MYNATQRKKYARLGDDAMLQKSSLTLSDGTNLDDLIMLDSNEVSLRVMSDKELYDIEMERVFAKTWLLLAHESEIPNSGDFVVRDMAEDNVIIARDREGNVNVSLNVCPHRGMRVCTAEAGNKPIHQCIYHGWAFKPDGDFIGAPVEREKMRRGISKALRSTNFWAIQNITSTSFSVAQTAALNCSARRSGSLSRATGKSRANSRVQMVSTR
jgi:nitrite reductase/ring-hydroxylating ferredoxin subunit